MAERTDRFSLESFQTLNLDHPSLLIELILSEKGLAIRYPDTKQSSVEVSNFGEEGAHPQDNSPPDLFHLTDPHRIILDIPAPGPHFSRTIQIKSKLAEQIRLESVNLLTDNNQSASAENNPKMGTRIVIYLLANAQGVNTRILRDDKTNLISVCIGEINPKALAKFNTYLIQSLKQNEDSSSHIAPSVTKMKNLTVNEVGLSEDSADTPIKKTPNRLQEGKESAAKPNDNLGEDANNAVLERYYYKLSKVGKIASPALHLEVSNLHRYELSRKGADLFQLVLYQTQLGNSASTRTQLLLPTFPPQGFGGLLGASAGAENGNVIIDISVEQGYQLEPFRTSGSLWIRAVSADTKNVS